MPTAGNDTITGTSGNDVIDGLAGDDVINGMDGNDFLYGGLGNDSVSGGDGNDYLAGIGGRDTLAGGNGDDTLVLGEGVYAEAFGGAGRDTFQMGFASSFSTARISVIYDLNFNEDVFFAQSGYSITTGLSIDGIGIGNDIHVTAIGHRIDILNPIMPTVRLGTNLADNLFGTLLSDTLNGLGGNDTLNGGGGNDSLLGGDGDDWIIDQDGFSTDGDDTVRGGAGNDRISDGVGNDVLDGGEGDDRIELFNGGNTAFGGPGRDVFTYSLGGSDTIVDFDRLNDTLFGFGDGNEGRSGLDLDFDGELDDAAIVSLGSNSSSVVLLNFANTVLIGTGGADSVVGLPFNETVFGGDGGDSIDGRVGADVLSGDAGNDTLVGGSGDDSLLGGAGNDLLSGGEGRDTLIGGDGDDTLSVGSQLPVRASGGAGRDLFQVTTFGFSGIGDHTITDFSFSDDRFSVNEASSIQFALDLDGDQNSDDVKVVFGSQLISLFNVTSPGRLFRSGSDTSELIDGSIVDDQIEALAGNDQVSGGSGNDVLLGQDGADTLSGGSGSDLLSGGAGADALDGGAGDDTLIGGDGNDTFFDINGVNTFSLGGGADWVRLDFSNISTRLIVMDFSMGEDELFLSESSAPTQTLLDIDQDGEIDDVRIITVSSSTIDLMSLRPETRYLTDADDFRNGTLLNETIVGLSGNDFIFGADGNDSVFGGAGNDRLSGGRGNDALFGEAGNDSMSGDLGDDYLSGGDGNDTLTTDTGNDVAFGGDGDDRIIASTATGGGPQGTDLMFGEAGNDLIELGEALEYVDAGSGNDLVRIMQISGGASLDTLHGGAGIDTLSLVGFATGSLTVNLAWSLMQDQSGAFGAVSGFERIEFGAANDAVVGWTGNPVIDLGAGADWFADFSPVGAAANDTVFGGAGDDAIYGLAGDDTLNGGDGNDFVIGGDGADTLDGGLGADWMAGGAGADVFVFRSNTMFGIPTPPPMPANGFDVVAQFQPGVDKIDLRQLDGNPNVIGFQSLTIGDFAVGSPGRLRWSSPAGQTYTVVEADLNGDAVRDFVFIVYGETNGQVTQVQLSAADFLL